MRGAALWVVIAVLALAYPVMSLGTGTPEFPMRDDCVQPATSDGEISAVFGYFDTELEAAPTLDRALEVGFVGTDMEWNGCGQVRVFVNGIPTLEVGREFVEEARGVGFEVTLEQAN